MLSNTPVASAVAPVGDERLTFRSRQFMIAGTVVALAPLLLLLFNRNWFLTRENVIDAWNYVGFFEHYSNPEYASGAYKLARLPWILTGYVVHELLPPLSGAYLLHGVFLCATPLALFAALFALLRRMALAAVVATMFGFYTHAHGSGSWDYHNTEAGALYFLSVLTLALPSVIAGRRVSLVLTGVVLALTMHTNILLVNFLPVLALVHLRTVQLQTGAWPRLSTLVERAAWVVLGGVCITIALGAINSLVGREFFFFGTLVGMVSQFVSDPQQYQTQFWRPWGSGWLQVAKYLALPSAVFLAGMVWFLVRRPAESVARHLAAALVGQFFVMVLVWIAWQADEQTALDRDYMAYPVTLSGFLAFGALLLDRWPDALERHWLAAVTGTAALCAICLSGVFDPLLTSVEVHIAAIALVVGFLVFGAALLQYLLRPGLTAIFVLIAIFAFGNRLMANRPGFYAITDPCKFEPAMYPAIVEASAWLWTHDPTHDRLRTWFDEEEQIHPLQGCNARVARIGIALSAVAWLPYVTNPFPMPAVADVPDRDLQQLADSNILLAIVSSKADNLEKWNTRLVSAGLSATEVASHTAQVLESEFAVHLWKVERHLPEDVRFAPIMEITDRTKQETNVYGTSKGGITTDGDRVVFTPTSPRDHVAYAYVPLRPLTNDVWARVVVESPANESGSCQLIVQAQDFTTLATLSCTSGSYLLRVPMSTREMRLYLTDPTEKPFTLPPRIELALSEP